MKMDNRIDYNNIDKVFNLFCNYYPFGINYFTLTSRFNFSFDESETIYDFLVDEGLIENWGEVEDKHILSDMGIEVNKNYEGIEDYIICCTLSE